MLKLTPKYEQYFRTKTDHDMVKYMLRDENKFGWLEAFMLVRSRRK